MKIGLYPGSFDPITLGHLGVIEKGAKIFDKLYVCVLVNSSKKAMFKDTDRVKMISEALKKFKNVEVVKENCLTIEACKKYNASFILRGLRSSADFEFEFEFNNVNQALDNSIETVLVMTNIDESHISSSIVRELISYNSKDYKKLVPIEVYNFIENNK
ncbi:pantetheine-phosphate adenylyltransferase [bacterium]|nr:pantetheine-phosphate adenylyltransferase [bacterium]